MGDPRIWDVVGGKLAKPLVSDTALAGDFGQREVCLLQQPASARQQRLSAHGRMVRKTLLLCKASVTELGQATHYGPLSVRSGPMADRPSPRESLAKNLKMLIEVSGYTDALVAERAKVSPKTISNIKSSRHKTSLDTLDAIAKVFGLTCWHLIMPNLDRDMLKSPAISKLMDTYIHLNATGRANVDRVADMESKYEGKK